MTLVALLPIALKSLVIAAAVLLLLKLAERRSAADRSLIAHLGLAAILILPVAALALPTLDVVGPDYLATAPVEVASSPAPVAAAMPDTAEPPLAALAAPARDWSMLLYIVPAAILLGLTLLALMRLVLLKHRASVMVEAGWLSALALAQRRMGFKHGTALLSSDDLPSPISWGVVRPVILLNADAAGSSAEAEAVIAHELAHVANLDWAKLLLARITIALFWFNPLVWLLSREAHQLREEAADDAVLAANIEDTDYARLLVGVARHECRGLLIGAHGVAPAKNSLARRVRRVLDTALVRAPGGWRWSSAAAFFAAGLAVPLAALTVVPKERAAPFVASARQVAAAAAPANPADPVAPQTAAAASATATRMSDEALPQDIALRATTVAQDGSVNLTRHQPGQPRQSVAIAPHSTTLINGDRSIVISKNGSTVISRPGQSIAIASASAGGSTAIGRAVTMRALAITPDFVRSIAAAGYPDLDTDQLAEFRALGIDAAYIRSLAGAGYKRLSPDQLVELKAMGVTSGEIRHYRRTRGGLPGVDELIDRAGRAPDPDPDPGG